MDKEAMRRCLGGCNKFFFSSCPSERFCNACRKRIKAKAGYGVEIFQVTPAMERHMRAVEEGGKPFSRSVTAEQEESANQYLDDPSKDDFDDSFIYDEIGKEEDELFEELDQEAKLAKKAKAKARRVELARRKAGEPVKEEPVKMERSAVVEKHDGNFFDF